MKVDPKSASAALASILSESGSGGWTAPDPETAKAAIPLLAELPQLRTVEMTLEHNVKKWMESEPEAALQWVREFSEGQRFEYHTPYSNALWNLAKSEPQIAMDAIRELPPAARSAAFRNLGDKFAEKFPAETIALFEESLDGWNLADIAGRTARELAEDDGVAGAEFALMFADPDVRRQAIEEAVAQFRRRDGEGLEQWAVEIDDPALREEVGAAIALIEEREASINNEKSAAAKAAEAVVRRVEERTREAGE